MNCSTRASVTRAAMCVGIAQQRFGERSMRFLDATENVERVAEVEPRRRALRRELGTLAERRRPRRRNRFCSASAAPRLFHGSASYGRSSSTRRRSAAASP